MNDVFSWSRVDTLTSVLIEFKYISLGFQLITNKKYKLGIYSNIGNYIFVKSMIN